MKMTVKRWRERIRRALDAQKERIEEAERFMRAYAGDYNIKPRKELDSSKDDASVNFIYGFVETVRPALLPGTPRAFIEGRDPASVEVETSAQGLVNEFMRELGVKAELKAVIEDWFYSFAAFKTDWNYSEEPVFKPGSTEQEIDPESIPDGGDEEDGDPLFNVLKDEPLLVRLDPKDVVYDQDSKSRKADKWRAERIIFTYDEFKALPNIPKTVRKKVRPRMIPRELQRGGEDNQHSSTEKNYVICWRIYDYENYCTKLLVDSDGVEEFAEDLPWKWDIEAFGDPFPISILEAKRDPRSAYSFSQFRAYWNQIQERNVLRTIIKATVRRNAPGWLGKKSAMDEEQKEKFIGSQIGEYVEVNNPDQVTIKPQFVLAPDFFNHDSQVADDTMNTSGLAEYQQQLEANTATQASIAEQKSNVRKGEAKADFNDFCAMIFTKTLKLCQQFLDEEKAIKIRTPLGPNEYDWLKVNKDKIQGSFHLSVKPGSDEADDENLRKQQDLKFAELMANNPHVNQRVLAKRIAKRHGFEGEEILRPEQEVKAEQAAAAAAEAAKSAPKDVGKDKMPLIDFSAIKVELLAPEVQAMIIAAALKQNEVPQTLSGGGGVPAGPTTAGPVAPGAPSLAAPPPGNSVMPGAEMNQTIPPMPGAEAPPMTPVQPASEMQGGPT